jgi:hypothetical protein
MVKGTNKIQRLNSATDRLRPGPCIRAGRGYTIKQKNVSASNTGHCTVFHPRDLTINFFVFCRPIVIVDSSSG